MARVTNGVSADMTGVLLLAGELRLIRSRLQPAMRNVTSESAMRIRQDARARWKAQTTGHRTRKYPQTITMEVTMATAALVVAEVGPQKGKQGSFGHLFEFGNSMSPGKPHLVPAWEAEIPKFVTALGLAAQGAVLP